MSTIPNLRKRAWSLANQTIKSINNLNEIIFEDELHKPEKIEHNLEDITNINLQYIQDGIDIFNKFVSEINAKAEYLTSIQNKHNECLDALKIILTP